MFGYVVANLSSLSEAQKSIYRGYYCGLCRCIADNFGGSKRLVLTYDMTFLTILLSSLYDLPEKTVQRKCVVHPVRKHTEITTAATHYAAAMNIALAYHNCLDDWADEKSMKSLFISKMLSRHIPAITAHYEEKAEIIRSTLAELSALEAQNLQEPDAGANVFGKLLGEIFAWQEDRWSNLLRQIGESLGRFIYLMDAVLDLPGDLIKGSYNPLRSRWTDNYDPKAYIPVLNIMLGECTDAMERLPLLNNIDLLQNILYEGVWTRFCQSKYNLSKEEDHV